MSKRLIGLIALFTLASTASPTSWSLNCTEIEGLLNQGLSTAAIEARIVAEGGDPAAVAQCITSIQARAQAQTMERMRKAAETARRRGVCGLCPGRGVSHTGPPSEPASGSDPGEEEDGTGGEAEPLWGNLGGIFPGQPATPRAAAHRLRVV
jgi:hypothetical protein